MKQGAKACPGARNFEQGRVEGVVLDALRDGALHPGVFGDPVREVQASLRSQQAEAEGERVVLQGQLAELNRRLDNLYEAVESGSIPASRLAPRIEKVSQEKEALEARIAALPAPGREPLLEIGEDDIEDWVSDLRAVVERGAVDERRGLLRAWVKRVVADGDELTVEYTFPLVSVAGPGGSEPGGAPSTRRVVNRRGRRKPAKLLPELRKGETALRRFLPTVVDGSPGWSAGGTWVVRARYPRETPRRERQKREGGPERWARWAAMVEGGMTKAEVARSEGVSRAAVTMGLRKLGER